MAVFKDITGQRFGRLTAISRVDRRTPNRNIVCWLCRCDCGTECVVISASLVFGKTQSCGCLRGIAARTKPTSHGMKRTGAYKSWQAMRARCLDPNSKHYRLYGGRGIAICARWNDFRAFRADMGDRPPNMTLDRINSNGNYEPSNCRWATLSEQGRNTSQNRIIEHNGERRCVTEWAEIYGLPFNTLLRRLARGDSAPRIFRPVRPMRRHDPRGKFTHDPESSPTNVVS